MGSLTEKYQQLRNGTEEKQRIEQEMQKQEAYYGNIINRTKFLNNKFEIDHSDHGISFERYNKYKNTYNYSCTLLPKLDPQRQALFQEAAKLIREDKWISWKMPGKKDTSVIKHCYSLGEHEIYYELGSYIKTKWADGSIHVGGHKRYFRRKYEVLGGLMDDIRKMVAQKAAYREMQEYFRLISNAAVGASSYVELEHSNRSIVLFRDGDVLDRGQYIEKMSIKELEDFLAEAVNRINK